MASNRRFWSDDDNDDGHALRAGSAPCNFTVTTCTAQATYPGDAMSPTAPLDDPGNANPGNLFRLEQGSYVFNLSTKDMPPGAYTLDFTIGNDPTIYHPPFTLR